MRKFIFSILAAASILGAHQVLTEEIGTNKYSVKFWTHDGFGAYDSSQVIAAKAYGKDLKPIKTGINYKAEDGVEVLTDAKPAVMATTFDALYWVTTNKGTVEGKKSEADGIVFGALKSMKIGKTYYEWSDALINPVGLKYEVVALRNPLETKVGESLPVLVLKDGKAASGVKFETGYGDIDAVTNSNGIALIPIKETGLNLIAARFDEELYDDKNAEKLLMQSSISFMVK